jgi:hypothetical protein
MGRAEAEGGMHSPVQQATLAFNRARLLEASGDFRAAETLYRVGLVVVIDEWPLQTRLATSLLTSIFSFYRVG